MRKPQLTPEDQARVDAVTRRGVNSVERKPFRVWILLGIILLALTVLSGVSYLIASLQGVV